MILSSSTPTHPTPLFATFLYNDDQSIPKDTIQIQRHKNTILTLNIAHVMIMYM